MPQQRLFLLSYVLCVHVLSLGARIPPPIKHKQYANVQTEHFNKTGAGEDLNTSVQLVESKENHANLLNTKENQTNLVNTKVHLVETKENQAHLLNTKENLTSLVDTTVHLVETKENQTHINKNKENQTLTHEINISMPNQTGTTTTPINASPTTSSGSTDSTSHQTIPNSTTTIMSTAMISTTQTNITSTRNLSTESTTTADSESTITSEPEHNSPHALPGWALGIILGLVAVVVIIITLFIFIRYRRSKIPLAQPVHSLLGQISRKSVMNGRSRPIPLSSFPSVYQNKFMDETFNKEFREIQDYSAELNLKKSRDVGKMEENRTRNRFVDIIPFDDNYVTLSTREGNPPSDYINASYVEGLPQCGKFIVTQGPKQNTVVEFWKMIVEKQCRTIIMLTNLQEAGRVKCFQYWPPSGQMLHFDDISLFTTEETDVHTGTMARKIEVSMEDDPESEVFSVRQLHLTNWPDHGVPETTNSLLAFLRVSRDFLDQGYNVIHCSAGVGRTGTYLALLSLTEQIRTGAETVDVLSTVKSLRESRSKMVQTEEQYIFLHQAISDFIKTGEGSAVVPGDDVLDDGVDNFGFEHVRL